MSKIRTSDEGLELPDLLVTEGVNRMGFGTVPKLVMRDQRLTIEAKAVYAYLCSYAGSGEIAFPSRTTILDDLGISKGRFYRNRSLLIELGYIDVIQSIDNRSGRYRRCTYILKSVLKRSAELIPEEDVNKTKNNGNKPNNNCNVEPCPQNEYAVNLEESPRLHGEDIPCPQNEYAVNIVNNNRLKETSLTPIKLTSLHEFVGSTVVKKGSADDGKEFWHVRER